MSSQEISAAWSEWLEALRAKLPGVLLAMVEADAPAPGIRKGDQHVFRSPLREDKTPSFYVYATQDRFFDFGTKESGDVFAYVMRRDGCDFRAAADVLASRAGHPRWEEARPARAMTDEQARALLESWKREGDRHRVFGALTRIVNLCHDLLPSKVRAHLYERGFDDDTIDREQIGWIPDGLHDLVRIAMPDVSEATWLETGMFVKIGNALKAQMSERIVFPYWYDGLVRYAIGRRFDCGIAESEILKIEEHDRGKYKKLLTRSAKFPYVSDLVQNDVLWGEESCANKLTKTTTLLDIEGITDALLARQIGLDEVVSPVTTQPSAKQRERFVQLGRRAKEIVIVNDNDVNADGRKPGEEGAKRTAAAAWEAGIHVRIATIPKPEGASKIDVCEWIGGLLRAGMSRDEVRARFLAEIVDPAVPYPEFVVRDVPRDAAPGVLEETLRTLGSLGARLPILQRSDLLERFLKRFPKVPKREARRVFTDASQAASRAMTEREKTEERERADIAAGDAPRLRMAATYMQDIGSIEKIFDEGGTRTIATFSLDPIRLHVSDDGPSTIVCRVVAPGADVLVDAWPVPPRAWTSKRDFLRALPHHRMQFVGNDDDVQGILAMLSRECPRLPHVRTVSALGAHDVRGSLRFVTVAGTLDEAGWMESPDVAWAPDGGCSLAHKLPRVRSDLDEGEALAREVIESIPDLHDRHVIWSLAGWMTAALFRASLLRRGHGGFALCQAFGGKGAGKTSVATDLLWRIFGGVAIEEPLAAGGTTFSMLKDLASTNAIPLVFDEYKLADMRNADAFRRYLRRAYAGEAESRGRADQGMNTWTLVAPVLLLGEERLEDDAALVDRTLYVPMSANYLPKHPEVQAIFRKVVQRPLELIAPVLWRWRLREEPFVGKWLEEAEIEVEEATWIFRPPPSVRMRLTLVQARFGVLAFAAFSRSLSVFLQPPSHVPQIRTWYRDMLDAEHDDIRDVVEPTNGDGKGAVLEHLQVRGRDSDAFDGFLADATVLAQLGEIREGVHYAWFEREGGVHLFLSVRAIESVRLAWRRTQGLPSTSPGANALRRLAKENLERDGYVRAVGHPITLTSGAVTRGILVDPERAGRAVEGFPRQEMNVRSWGGFRPRKFGEAGN